MSFFLLKELHSQLLAAESEMNNKNKELQTLHSNLNEAMLSKEQLERRVLELMEMSQRSVPDETVQAHVQVSCYDQFRIWLKINHTLHLEITLPICFY